MPKLGRNLALQLFDLKWTARQKALQDLNQGLKSFEFHRMDRQEVQEMFIALLAVVNRGCADKVAAVSLEAIELFLAVMDDYYREFTKIDSKMHKEEFGVHINMIIDSLLVKIGDPNQNLKFKAAEALVKSSFYPLIGAGIQIERILSKKDSKGNPALAYRSPKHLAARL